MRGRTANTGNTGSRWLLIVIGILVGCVLVYAQMPIASADKKSSEVFKNLQVLKDIPSDQLVPSMKFISSALGVRCEYCHVENAFDKDDKKPKQIARKMMQMMFAINSNNFEGHQEVTCYSCHRGSPKPVAIPVISESMPRALNAPVTAPQPNPPDLPKVDEIMQKYIGAIGGANAISKMKTLVEHASADLGGRKFQQDILIKSPNRVAIVTHFPGANGITSFDGKSGFISFPGSPARPMSPGDLDAARMDADLQFPLDWRTFFSEIDVTKKVNVGDKETILLIGKRTRLPDMDMYFDAQSGLLARVVRYEASALGLNPTQIDYSDYRDAGGMKVPFHWTSAAPTGRFSVQVESVEPNAAVNDDIFAKPPAGSPPSSPQ
jgi:hypothetical protein